jgi:hypothetical protein
VLLATANNSPVRGELRLTQDIWCSLETLQERTQLDDVTFHNVINAFNDIEILTTNDEPHHLVVSNWEKRQFESDNVAARVRKHREKKKLETLQKRSGNVPDTDTDTDIKDSPPQAEKPKRQTKYTLAMDALEEHYGKTMNPKRPFIPDWNKLSKSDKQLMQKRWRSPLKRMWERVGKDTELSKRIITDAIAKSRKDKMDISAPQSIESNFYHIFDNQPPTLEDQGYVRLTASQERR